MRKHCEIGAFYGLRNALIIEIVLIAVIVGCCAIAHAQEPRNWDVNLAWDANTEADLREYRLYENGAHVETIPAGTEIVSREMLAGTHEWHLTAVDDSLNESLPSNTVGITLDEETPLAPTNLNIGVITILETTLSTILVTP